MNRSREIIIERNIWILQKKNRFNYSTFCDEQIWPKVCDKTVHMFLPFLITSVAICNGQSIISIVKVVESTFF